MKGTMASIGQTLKIDEAIKPASSLSTVSKYFKLDKFFRALFIICLVAITAGVDSTVVLKEATDASGTGAADITGTDLTISSADGAVSCVLTVGSPTNADTVTINGIVFTKASSKTVASREFNSAADLEDCINNATYGVEGVTASNNAGAITLTSTEPGEKSLTVTSDNATELAITNVSSIAYIEIDADMLSEGFDHVAASVVNGRATVTGAVIIREGRFSPEQAVADSVELLNS